MRDPLQLAQSFSLSAGPVHDAEFDRARTRLAALWAQVTAIDPHPYERDDGEGVERFRALVEHVLGEIIAFASELMAHCDRQLGASMTNGERCATQPLSLLSDVCFMAVSESSAKRAVIGQMAHLASTLQALSACGSALRRARKALVSMDAELARSLHKSPLIDGTIHLAESLEIRKQYGLLRRAAGAEDPPDATRLRMRLNAIELRIVLLRERDIYHRLRLDDRVALHVLQQRLLAWLGAPTDLGVAATEGIRLWQDAVGFTHLLHQVNLRQELRAHDAAVVLTAMARLEDHGDNALDDDGAWNELKALLGLYDRLDDLLRRNDRCVSQCRALLGKLAESLRSSTSPLSPEETDPLDLR